MTNAAPATLDGLRRSLRRPIAAWINRATLREAGLAIVRGGYASIPDTAKLSSFAQFDPTYLYLEPTPR